jgi:hypothetical protein
VASDFKPASASHRTSLEGSMKAFAGGIAFGSPVCVGNGYLEAKCKACVPSPNKSGSKFEISPYPVRFWEQWSWLELTSKLT